MTVRNLIDNFSKLIGDYNQHQSEKPSNISMYNPAVQEQKVQEYLLSGIKIYEPKFRDLKLDIEVLKAQKIKEKNQKMFPLKYSENLAERQLGEQKLAYSLLFFNIFKGSPNLILIELKKMVDMKDFDSFFLLVDCVKLLEGSEGFDEIFSFVEAINQDLKINEFQADLETLKNLEENIEKVLSALETNIPYILLNFQIQNMTDDQYFELRERLISRFGESVVEKIYSLG